MQLTKPQSSDTKTGSTGAESSLLKNIEGPVELGVTSARKGFWINVHKDVRLHA